MRGIRILIFHGYLLRGTGSNVYNASLARALARLGHEVHLLCQDRRADLPGVTVHVPDIGGLLPVYVKDRYEGFEVKTFGELSEAELNAYLEANVAAVRDVVRRAGDVDAALANHAVMGPAILARAGLGSGGERSAGYAVKIHGSALEFTVKRDPDRFLPYAREGLAGASGVLVGSRHTADVLWETLSDATLPARTRLGPPGVDTELFSPLAADEARGALRKTVIAMEGEGFGRDAAAAARELAAFSLHAGPRIVFVGKLIPTKGVELLLEAWPGVLGRHPRALLLVVGFGESREAIEALAAAGPDPNSVRFTGRLEHEEVARVVALADAMVVPSTFPEAFGMVAAEAAAAGVLPICADHSGLREVAAALAVALPAEAARLVSFPLEAGAGAIAERLCAWLELPEPLRERSRAALAATARERWSWEGVARGVLAAAAGSLDELPAVPEALPAVPDDS